MKNRISVLTGPLLLSLSSWEVFFIAQSAESPFPYTLWRTDRTEAGTRKLAEVDYPISGIPIEAVRLGGRTILVFKGSGRPAVELWVTDGTAAGTRLAQDIFPGPTPSAPEQLTAVPGKLFFAANDGVHGRELWLETSPR